jgi:hypothetical protein
MSVLKKALQQKELLPAAIECIFERYMLKFDPYYQNEVNIIRDEREFVVQCIETFVRYCRALNAHERQEVVHIDEESKITFGDLYNSLQDGNHLRFATETLKKVLVEIVENMPADAGPLTINQLPEAFDRIRNK